VISGLEPFITAECDDIPEPADATATDNCGDATITSVDAGFSGGCQGAIERVYTATDECGNTSTYTQIINVVDTTSPVFVPMPLEITAECDDIPAAAPGEATDNCGDVTIDLVETDFSGGCQGAIERTYTATDECGNTAVFIQIVNIVDTTNPEITANADATVECTEPFDLAGATATDNCDDDVTIESDSAFVAACGNTGVWTITYTATDDCNNTATATQTITIVDTTAPSVTANPDATVECGDEFDLAGATGSDTCGEVTIESDSAFVADCGDTGVWTITYTATDDCGNSAIDSQTITIVDTTDPVISGLEPIITVECDDIPEPSDATGTDACGDVTITVVDASLSGGCQGSIERVYTATDECGNTSTYTQILLVVDTTPPTITPAADATVECGDELPAPDATATDNCGDATWTVTADITDTCGDTYVMVRTYTATDECNNTATATQTITVVDTTAPSVTANADATVECGDDFDLAGATGSDTCGEVTIESDSAFVADCGNTGVWTITYTATDDCGNTATDSQTITIVDTTAPSVTANADATVECGDDFDLAGATGSDVCGEVTIESDSAFVADCGDTGVWTITYTATDDCGNSATDSQTITIVDTTAPEISGLEPLITAECDDIPGPADATATDVCGDATITVEDSGFSGGCQGAIQRTYTATDDCGNTSTYIQIINVVDTTSPVITTNPDATVECGDDFDLAGATATDNCDDDVTIESDSAFVAACGETGVWTITYTATDDCDNTATATQTITIVDTTPPTVTAPANMIAECGADLPDPSATATDTCGDATWTVEESFVGDCGETGVYTRVYTATDECGNTATDSHTITIVDTTPPTVTANPDATVECGDDFDLAGATGADTCGEVTIESDSAFVADCGNSGVWTITYTATDDCGNTATDSQTITIVDTTDPVISGLLPFITAECDDIPGPDEATATDNCGDATVTVEDSGFSGGCQGAIQRIYTATDECGNTSTYTQIVNVVDTTPPTITPAADATVECGDELPAPDATATDNCGDATWTVTADVTDTCGDTYVMVRTYTATDECNNTATATQTITVVDTTAPSVTANADATVECGDDFDLAGATGSDTCGEVTIESDSAFVADCGDTGVWTITYTATDDCGNTATDSQTITIVDTAAPSVTANADATVECGDDFDLAGATGSDTCGEVTIESDSAFVADCGNSGVWTITYTATDDCGNSATDSQTITIVDTTDPVISGLEPFITAECDDIPGPDEATATDNCGDATVTVEDSGFSGGCQGAIQRIYTATDECGNTSIYTQIVNVVDTTPPTITPAADATVECGDELPAPDATATDNCGDATWTVTADITDTCGDTYVMVRTYTATDECNNTSTATQTITVVDTTAPSVTANADATVECGDDFDLAGATGSDTCGEVTIESDSAFVADCGNTGVWTITYTATDDCGNTATDSQTITVVDTTAPVLSGVPADDTAECDAIPAPASPTASDVCSDEVSVTLSESEVAGNCDGEKTITRTWTATDACGNTAQASQSILVIDTTAPIFDDEPADETYTCGDEIPAAPEVTATDNCSEMVSVVLSEVTEGNTNPNLDCALTTGEPSEALGNDQVWSMFLEEGGVRDYFILDEDGAQFTEIPLGGGEFEAHLTGTLVHADNADDAWMMDVWLIQKTDYDGWTGQLTLGNPAVPRQAKTFNGVANPGDELDWDYWVLDGTRSQLIGVNNYAGDILALDHAPSNLLFAFEVGEQANNYSEGYGIGGWFSYSGTINGVASSGQGDFAFSADCPPCEYTITRTWTATDDCGNSAVTTQVVTVNAPEDFQGDDDDALISLADQVYGFVSAYPNPTGGIATLVYRVPVDTDVVIEVISGAGKALNTVYNGAALSGVDNYAQFDGSVLNNGVYIVRMTTDNNVFYQKVVLSK
jgi:hypothetical protein